MSYDVELMGPDGTVLPFGTVFAEGGTQRVGGTDRCELNITYNYAEVFGGLVRELNGKRASDTIDDLRAFVARWPNARPYERDYWAPTPGNAKVAIERLITFADRHPDGVWHVF